MKNISNIIFISSIIIIIISITIIVFKYIEFSSNNNFEKEDLSLLEKYTPLENLTSNDFDLKSCVENNYYTLINSNLYYDETNDFIVYHKDELDKFITNVNSDIPDVIRIVQHSNNERESFIKELSFTKDKFILKNDYRWFGNFSEEDKKIVTTKYNAKDYKLIIDSTPIINEGAKTYYKINLISNNNSDLIYLCNYFEIPENNESNFMLEFIKNSSNERQLILSKTESTKYDYDIYSYNGDVNLIINNETYTLRDALLNNKITIEEILNKANKDAEEKRIFRGDYLDGGSKDYFYNDYVILKYNNLAGNKDMYIGDTSMDIDNLNESYYNSYLERPNTSITFNAVVVYASNSGLLVYGIGNSSGLCSAGFGDKKSTDFKKGQEIVIYYDGIMLETYPPKFGYIEKIEIVKENSDAEIPEDVLRYAYSSIDNVTYTVNNLTKNGISFSIKDTNELQYKFSNEYSLWKKVKNENYTGVGQVIGENTENSTAGYTRNWS